VFIKPGRQKTDEVSEKVAKENSGLGIRSSWCGTETPLLFYLSSRRFLPGVHRRFTEALVGLEGGPVTVLGKSFSNTVNLFNRGRLHIHIFVGELARQQAGSERQTR
jgi:hypothetical protein